MDTEQIMTPITIKLDGVHTGEVKEILIDKPISLLVMVINRDTIFETMYCCDGLGDNQMPYIAFKYDHRLINVLNLVFDKMNEYKGIIRTEIHIKYLRDAKQKHKAILIRGVVGKAMLSKLYSDDKVLYLNTLKDALRDAIILPLEYNIQHWCKDLGNYWSVKNIIGKMDYYSRLNQ